MYEWSGMPDSLSSASTPTPLRQLDCSMPTFSPKLQIPYLTPTNCSIKFPSKIPCYGPPSSHHTVEPAIPTKLFNSSLLCSINTTPPNNPTILSTPLLLEPVLLPQQNTSNSEKPLMSA
ncbi:hypothetical protein HHK36_027054 [Tetracentron sinense]|uniref:Uncharacterized protein n=1 Tax=Tetracentron sinense TaxID=13715 RepID=A0A834YM08_TETSI|nr:hypothetical protein HHK36_027054 [Tetracentron sinense]